MLFTTEIANQLLKPISENEPCGVYLKGDRSLYRPLRNEFNVALTSLRKLTQNPDANELDTFHDENIVNWQTVSNSLLNAFSTQSRDIELIGWMLASQIILDSSLHGFSKTALWCSQLAEINWDALQPQLPEKKLKSDTELGQQSERCAGQLNAFNQLLGESEESSLLYAPILMLPIVGQITFFQYQSAEKKGEIAALRSEAMRMVQDSRESILALLSNISEAELALKNLAEITRKQAQKHSVTPPNFRTVLLLLEKVKNAISQLTNLKAIDNAQVAPTEIKETTQAEISSVENNAPVNEPQHAEKETLYAHQEVRMHSDHSLADVANTNSMNRDKAFHQLRELAEFFRVSEPHSPVSFLIEKAIRWGYMPLPDLLNELLAEKQSGTESIFTVAGLNQSEQTVLPDIAHQTVSTVNKPAAGIAVNQNGSSNGISAASSNHTVDADTQQQSETKKTSSSSSSLRW